MIQGDGPGVSWAAEPGAPGCFSLTLVDLGVPRLPRTWARGKCAALRHSSNPRLPHTSPVRQVCPQETADPWSDWQKNGRYVYFAGKKSASTYTNLYVAACFLPVPGGKTVRRGRFFANHSPRKHQNIRRGRFLPFERTAPGSVQQSSIAATPRYSTPGGCARRRDSQGHQSQRGTLSRDGLPRLSPKHTSVRAVAKTRGKAPGSAPRSVGFFRFS